MSGEHIEITTQILHINLAMNRTLSSVNKNLDAFRMALLDYLLDRIDDSENIGNMSERHDLCPFRENLIEFLDHEMTGFIDRKYLKHCSLSLAEHLPWDNVRMVFRFSHYYLVTFIDEGFSETESYKIDRCCSSAGEDDFLSLLSIKKLFHNIPRLLICLGCLISKMMHSPVDIRIGFSTDLSPHIQYRLRPLACGCIVEIHKVLSINLSGKNREHISNLYWLHFNYLYRTCKFSKNNVSFTGFLS